MGYKVYYTCDYCGNIGGEWTNHTVSFGIAKEIARGDGWKIGKKGWVCPLCQKKLKNGKIDKIETWPGARHILVQRRIHHKG